MDHCDACPVAAGRPCIAARHRRYCDLAADPAYRESILRRSAELPDAEPIPPADPPAAIAPAPRPGLVPAIAADRFVTREQLARDTRTLLAALPEGIDTVVAVARSGFLPGADLATFLHLPLRAVSLSRGVTDFGHGGRMVGRDHLAPRHVLLIDDTAATGRAMREVAPIVRAAYPDAQLTTAVVYAHPLAADQVDLFVSLYPGKHYLEWNWQNAGHGERCGYDFDGILVPDMVPKEWTLESVLELQRTQPPLFLPRRTPVPLICTGRGEESREVSEGWLRRHGVRWDRLEMRPAGVGHDRESIARFKAEVYRESDCTLFAESDPRQSEIIAREARKPVLCPAAERVYRPPIAERSKLAHAARTCPHRECNQGCAKARCKPSGRRPGEVLYLSDCIECIQNEGTL